MKLEVRRTEFSPRSTIGRLAIDGQPRCYTLEPVWRSDAVKPRAIPYGTFELTIRWSARFKKHVPHIENVPGFTAVEMHVGNRPEDTEACTLVGITKGPLPDFIGQSVVAFSHLMSELFEKAELINPDSPEENHVWKVGTITFTDGREAEIAEIRGS
jgi:hypothetical protein